MNMNAYENLSSNAFESICRTCLMHGDLFVIDEISWERMDLKDVITYCCLQLESDDRLPNQMCRNCIRIMYETYQFLCKCRHSERVLKKILLNESIKSENEESNKTNLESDTTELENKHEIGCDNDGDITDVKDIVEETKDDVTLESDNDINADDPVEVEGKLSDIDDKAIETNSNNLLDKINVIKKQISKIRVKNKVRLRQLAKAQLMQYNNLPKTNKRPYIFRKGPPYNCITCDAAYQTYEELKRHKIETKHKKSLKYKCEYCERKFDAYCKFEEHVRTHTGEKPNKCPTCGKCFNFKTDLKRHMVMHMEVKPYVCRFCDKGFARRQYLVDHERKHTGEQLLCPFCGKGFHSYSTLSYHEKTHRGPTGSIRTSLTNDKLYRCHLCDKVLLTEYTLKAHVLLHGPKNFSCEICGKTYISKNRLQDHIKLTHQDHKYSCHLCKKEYKQKSGLDVHLKSHFGENNYPCDECGKQFACRGSLTQHKRIHTGDTKYQCKECFHICLNRRHLENHVRIHTGEKPFACTYCGKLFAQKANMQAHTKIHTNEKNHVCKLCNKAFYDTRGLKKHMAVHEKSGDDGNIA